MAKIKSLNNVKAGDTIAIRDWGYYSKWRRATVEQVTPQHILVEDEVPRFGKKDGSSKGNHPKTISIITQEIQEEWDREECKESISTLLKSKNIPSSQLREVIKLLNKYQ